MKITIEQFKGTVPKLAPHMLPTSAAQVSSNTRLTSGSLRALNAPTVISTPIIAGAQAIYSLGPLSGSTILSWSVDTDVARSPVSDNEYRIYTTDGTKPKKTNLALASGGAGPWPSTGTVYNIGVPAPTAAASGAVVAGGSVPVGTVLYVYTYVTQFGTTLLEESAQSPVLTMTTTSGNQTVNLTGIASPGVTTGYNYVYKRIYRTLGTAFQMVAQIPFANTTYSDTLSATGIAGDALATVGWAPPLDDLKGIVAMPSGTMAAFRNNEIWFSEPGFPHAWPAKYMQALDYPIVAIKAFGNNLAVATQAHPYVGSGVYPDSFTFTKIARLEPCASKRSMAGDEFGAIYASRNGLVSLGLDGDNMATAAVITRLEFNNFAPTSVLGAVFESRYYGFYSTGTYQGGFIFGRAEDVGIITTETGATAVTIEPMTGQMYFVNYIDNLLYSFDPTGGIPMTYTWRSKRFNVPMPLNFGYMQLHSKEDSVADTAYQSAVDAANAAIAVANAIAFATGNLRSAINEYTAVNEYEFNGSALQALIPSVASTTTLYVYSGSEIKYAKDVQFNKVYTLPSGYKTIGWDFVFIGQREISSFEIATSIQELKAS
jgi:hypothetical protein